MAIALRKIAENHHELSGKQLQAAVMVADDEINDADIAAHVGVSPRTLTNWKHDEAFKAAVAAHLAELSRYHVTRKDKRMKAADRRWRKLERVIDQRAERYGHDAPNVPGADTGLVVPIPRIIGSGPTAKPVIEWAVDTALLAELRQIEKQAAQEVGQWQEKVEHSGEAIVRHYVGVPLDQV